MKYKDNDKQGDSFLDRMIDDLIWGAPLGGGVGINLKTGNIIPYPSFDEEIIMIGIMTSSASMTLPTLLMMKTTMTATAR